MTLKLAAINFAFNAFTGLFVYSPTAAGVQVCTGGQQFVWDGVTVTITVQRCVADTIYADGFE